MKISLQHRILHFKQPAGTSRGVYLKRDVTYISLLTESGISAVGECAPLPKLSCDDVTDYQNTLQEIIKEVEGKSTEKELFIPYDKLRNYPSILMGLESANWQLQAKGSTLLFNTKFGKGERGIRINGLIWMGSFQEMKERIEEKLKSGFHCIKLKIGAINFDEELSLLKRIRQEFTPDDIELRVDANGAFHPSDAIEKLKRLSDFQIHSIEQPIRQGQWDEMARLCEQTSLPIALDEELIGVNDPLHKERLLETIKPQYIILKPTLHGGFSGSEEWLKMAESKGIGWWATSALESNVGLNAIAHWCAKIQEESDCTTWIPQGLGTGQLFTDNIPYPLYIENERLWYRV